MLYRKELKYKTRIVIKIGTASLSFPNGRLNFQRIERLVRVLSSIHNMGKDVILVSSGAIAAGAGRLGLKSKPADLASKQALAALGQAELIKIYQKFFEEYNQTVAQILLTRDVMTIPIRNKNARNTLRTLLDMNIIPIINENDTIATEEIEFGDNDTLSAYVATLIEADLLIMLSDIDGLYSADPKTDNTAEIIHSVHYIDEKIEELAKGASTNFSTGGMITKISAAKLCMKDNIDTIITNGASPEIIYDILDGEKVGTHFVSQKVKNLYTHE